MIRVTEGEELQQSQMQQLMTQLREDIRASESPGNPFLEIRDDLVTIAQGDGVFSSARRCAYVTPHNRIVTCAYVVWNTEDATDNFLTVFFCDPGNLEELAKVVQADVLREL